MSDAATPDLWRIRILAAFDDPESARQAVSSLKEHGYSLLEGFGPWEVEGIGDALELPRPRIALFTLLAGILGAIVGYGIQWWTNAVDYPINVGGRPLNPIPSFIMITFETTILFASIAAFLGVLLGSRLPMLWQPLFEVPGFRRASDDLFFIGIDERDPLFEFVRTREDLIDAGALSVERVPEARTVIAREKEASRKAQRSGPDPGIREGEPGPARERPAPGGPE